RRYPAQMVWWQWLLVIAAAFLLALLAFVAIAYWFIKRKLRGLIGNIAEAIGNLAGPTIPQTVELERATGVDLADDCPALAAAVVEAKGMGFMTDGPFVDTADGSDADEADPESAVVICTLADPSRQVVGLLMHQPNGTVTTDVMTCYDDATTITHSTMVGHLEHPPQRPKVAMPDADLAALLERHLADRPDAPRRAIAIDDVPPEAKRYVEEQWFWMATRAGVSDAEMRGMTQSAIDGMPDGPEKRDAEADDRDEQAARFAVAVRGQAQYFLEDKLMEKFREQTSMSVAEWEDAEHRIVLVHPIADVDTLAREVLPADARVSDEATESMDDEEIDAAYEAEEAAAEKTGEQLTAGELRANFRSMNDALPEALRLRFVQAVRIEDTLAAYEGDVYVSPRGADD
ncbi:MAG: hypothetical protein AAF078_00570, partial [Planctomycetota bacterium]